MIAEINNLFHIILVYYTNVSMVEAAEEQELELYISLDTWSGKRGSKEEEDARCVYCVCACIQTFENCSTTDNIHLLKNVSTPINEYSAQNEFSKYCNTMVNSAHIKINFR